MSSRSRSVNVKPLTPAALPKNPTRTPQARPATPTPTFEADTFKPDHDYEHRQAEIEWLQYHVRKQCLPESRIAQLFELAMPHQPVEDSRHQSREGFRRALDAFFALPEEERRRIMNGWRFIPDHRRDYCHVFAANESYLPVLEMEPDDLYQGKAVGYPVYAATHGDAMNKRPPVTIRIPFGALKHKVIEGLNWLINRLENEWDNVTLAKATDEMDGNAAPPPLSPVDRNFCDEIEQAEYTVSQREMEWEQLKTETKEAKDAFDAAVEKLRKIIRHSGGPGELIAAAEMKSPKAWWDGCRLQAHSGTQMPDGRMAERAQHVLVVDESRGDRDWFVVGTLALVYARNAAGFTFRTEMEASAIADCIARDPETLDEFRKLPGIIDNRGGPSAESKDSPRPDAIDDFAARTIAEAAA